MNGQPETDGREPDPSDAGARARSLLAAGDPEAARQLLDGVCRSGRGDAETWFLLAGACAALERLDEVVHCCRQVVTLNPGHARAWYNLGLAYFKLHCVDAAIASYQQALALEPAMPGVLGNLGAAWLEAGDLQRAEEYCGKAVTLDPQAVAAINTLGIVRREMGRYADALSTFEQGLHMAPNNVDLRWNRALALLKCGDFERGWDEFEWRWQYATAMQRGSPYPRWLGRHPARPLLVYMEQGIGDQIMFSSCLPDLQAAGSDAIVECAPRLLPLFERSFPGMRFYGGSWDERRPECRIAIQRQIPMGSLPRIFRRRRDAFPARTSYLRADASLVSNWRAVLAMLPPGPKIGISWRGGNDTRTRAKRSIALTEWRALTADTNVQLIDVQYGDRTEDLVQARAAGLHIHSLAGVDAMTDLDTFAALLAALDLLVTVDNSTLHLAGALGIETWALLPYDSDWRWEAGASTTAWYPAVHLLHQPQRDDWSAPLQAAAAALARRANRPASE